MTDQLPPAGWYPAPHANNEQRYWDGTQWQEPAAPSKAQTFASNLTAKHDPSSDPSALWSAVGKPLTGLGAGRYKLTAEFLYFEKGTLSTKSQQIRTSDIYDVDASQTIAQKARGIGTITLFAERAGGEREKVVLEDVPGFREGVAAINDAAFTARESLRVRQNTQHVSYGGGSAPSFAPTASPAHAAPAAATAGLDLNAELTKLAELKAQGILDDEEFAAAKRKLLGL